VVGPGAVARAGQRPAATVATLRARSSTAYAESPEEAYAIGERSVLDLGDRAGETTALAGS